MMPDKLLFPQSDKIYSFNTDWGQFQPSEGFYLGHRIRTDLLDSEAGAYYVISIYGLKKDELPNVKDFRLTFKTTVTKDSIEAVGNYLKTHTIPTASLTGAGCTPGFDSHICLKTITNVTIPGSSLPEADLWQTIAAKGTYVPGNVSAPGQIAGFSLGSHSLAVGGTITVDGGTKLEQYLSDQSLISWNKVGSKINDLFDKKGVPLGTTTNSPGNFNGRHYSANSWNLTAPLANPAAGGSTSFSSPPEGKLWKIVVSGNELIVGNGSSGTNFSGSGTIMVVGDNGQEVNITFNGPVTCSSGTRLSFMAKGSITFQPLPSDNYDVEVGCGAYTSLNGNINFAPGTVKSGNLKGIFVAKNNIVLPKADNLVGAFVIKRDDALATNPTSLLREMLNLVFQPS